MSGQKNIIIITSIYLEPHNTISAFVNSLRGLLESEGFSVKVIQRDLRRISVRLLDSVRYALWLLGVKGIGAAYLSSYKTIVRIMQKEIERHLNYIEESNTIIANDILAAAALASITPKRYVLVLHGRTLREVIAENPLTCEKNKDLIRWFAHIELSAILRSHTTIIVDRSLRRYVQKVLKIVGKEGLINKLPIVYLPNPVDLKIFKKRKRIIRDELIVITHVLSSSTLGKDYPFLVKVLRKLKGLLTKANKRAILLIVGDPVLLPRNITESIAALNSRDFIVKFLGRVPNAAMPLIYSTTDMVINPLSKYVSGISRTSLETMLCGAIPVTTPEGAIYPVIDMKTAVIVPRDPEKAAQKLFNVIMDNDLMTDLKRNALLVATKLVRQVNIRWLSALTKQTKLGEN